MSHCPLKAIDGTHIAEGRLTVPQAAAAFPTSPEEYDWYLTSDGSLLAEQQSGAPPAIHYFTLEVMGEQVKLHSVVRPSWRGNF